MERASQLTRLADFEAALLAARSMKVGTSDVDILHRDLQKRLGEAKAWLRLAHGVLANNAAAHAELLEVCVLRRFHCGCLPDT